jgi:hypothetical protein
MKLKLLVTTMIVAGAASMNAFADDMQAQLDAMKAQIAQMQASMNANNAATGLPSTGWFNRISVSGMANFDANGAWSRSPVNFTTKNPSDIQITNANLFVDANVSDWTKLHLGTVYSTDNTKDFNFLRAGAFNHEQADRGNSAYVDEAYATIGNFAKSPFYLKAGQQYLPFGSYTPYADVTPSLTQVLSQVNDPAAVVGFVANNGINGSLYALEGLHKISSTNGTIDGRTNAGDKPAIRNWGASLGVQNAYNNVGYNAGIGYLYNMADVTGVAYALTNSDADNGVSGYTKATGAVAANAGIKVSAFDADVKYVTAVQKFKTSDVVYDNGGNIVGAKPAAWAVDAGYSFPVLAHDSRVGLGYQGSKQASGLDMYGKDGDDFTDMGLSKTRYLANYTVNVSKYTDLGFEIRHDVDYSVSNGGTGNSANTATARLAVKFA